MVQGGLPCTIDEMGRIVIFSLDHPVILIHLSPIIDMTQGAAEGPVSTAVAEISDSPVDGDLAPLVAAGGPSQRKVTRPGSSAVVAPAK